MDYKVSDAKGFYIVFLGSLIVGDIIDLSPISAVNALYYSQIFDGILLPILTGLLLVLGNNKNIMGINKNGLFNNIFLTITFIISLFATIYMFCSIL